MGISTVIRPGGVTALIDGQFGSTGKGLLASKIAENKYDICTTNASANAGHTAIVGDRKIVAFHLPITGILNPNSMIYINAGAIIDPGILVKECNDYDIDPKRVHIHPFAAIIEEQDKEYEANKFSGATKIASTQKGVGRALARRVMREGKVARDEKILSPFNVGEVFLHVQLKQEASICMEIPQGFGLSNPHFYPHCTSRAVNIMQALSDALIHPYFLTCTIMSMRTYPIRVGNIPDEIDPMEELATTRIMGYSGDCYPDSKEITWEELGQAPEKTTVTKRIRRVFTWSDQQYRDALLINRPNITFLNFCNYFTDEFQFLSQIRRMREVEKGVFGTHLDHWYGFGPKVTDIRIGKNRGMAWYRE